MPQDLRQYSRQTFKRLIIGGLVLLFGVGGALIFHFYGGGAAALALLCLAVGLVPVGLIIIILAVMEWIVERNH